LKTVEGNIRLELLELANYEDCLRYKVSPIAGNCILGLKEKGM